MSYEVKNFDSIENTSKYSLVRVYAKNMLSNDYAFEESYCLSPLF